MPLLHSFLVTPGSLIISLCHQAAICGFQCVRVHMRWEGWSRTRSAAPEVKMELVRLMTSGFPSVSQQVLIQLRWKDTNIYLAITKSDQSEELTSKSS